MPQDILPIPRVSIYSWNYHDRFCGLQYHLYAGNDLFYISNCPLLSVSDSSIYLPIQHDHLENEGTSPINMPTAAFLTLHSLIHLPSVLSSDFISINGPFSPFLHILSHICLKSSVFSSSSLFPIWLQGKSTPFSILPSSTAKLLLSFNKLPCVFGLYYYLTHYHYLTRLKLHELVTS